MSKFELQPVFVPDDDATLSRVVQDGLHNAWAVLEDGEIKYAFEFSEIDDERSQRANAERILEWCERREALYGAR